VSDRRLGGERGSVVAEFAVALPAVALVLMLGVGALGVSARHVRLQDAVADASRLAARGEGEERVSGFVSAAVPGATSVIVTRDDLVCVTASAEVSGGVPLILTATSCALAGGL
jgi:hypothetical protein